MLQSTWFCRFQKKKKRLSAPTLPGALKDSANMDGAYSVALDVDAGLAYVVAASNSGSLAIVDVATAITWCARRTFRSPRTATTSLHGCLLNNYAMSHFGDQFWNFLHFFTRALFTSFVRCPLTCELGRACTRRHGTNNTANSQ